MDNQNRNLILATALSFLVILVWFWIFPPEETMNLPEEPTTAEGVQTETQPVDDVVAEAVSEGTVGVNDAPRLIIETPNIAGSISLYGGRIDDLFLAEYRETIEPNSPTVQFLRAEGEVDAHYASFGWTARQGLSAEDVPGPNTLWAIESGEKLTPETPVTLVWENGKGQVFRRLIEIDDEYMFTISQSVENTSGEAISLAPYGMIRRHSEPDNLRGFFVLHEGLVRISDGSLDEAKYDDIVDYDIDPREQVPADRIDVEENGWIGFTDHYWESILAPTPGQSFRSVAKYYPSYDIYQAEAVMPEQQVAAGASATNQIKFFAGAKEWAVLSRYEKQDGIEGFVDSIDWGWFFFLTKPIFQLLHWLNGVIGNMGWAIIGLTIILKLIVLPLAYKSYVSMARMKELQPEMEKLREAAGDDRAAIQQGMMKLYKDNKVNPASGCLPILIQIPIFFSLYKVIFVTIELRHAPWFGWLQDLSAPDPSSILNLFGLLPWGVPDPSSLFAIFSLGILPILLGISMWLQQKLNPAPPDPTQRMIFAWMPWIFMFMLGNFASGLVLYWITNNTITFIQQYAIMRSHGAKPDVFGNIKSSFKRKPKDDPAKASEKK